jgi:hypothetical protein
MEWEPRVPDPGAYQETMEPHKRGSILVAAIFEAFISIYNRRVNDLFRIASGGTGVMPEGELHPDLVNRLAREASKTSRTILEMCIRAIDYCPPMDITFGDYLQAIITADFDLVREDEQGFRLAFIDAFRKRGIFPESVKSLSVESLRLPVVNPNLTTDYLMGIISHFLRDYAQGIAYETNRQSIYHTTRLYIAGSGNDPDNPVDDNQNIKGLHERIGIKFQDSPDFINISGLCIFGNVDHTGIRMSPSGNHPSFQIKNLRLVTRTGPGDTRINQVVFSIVQTSYVVMENGKRVGFFRPGKSGTIPKSHKEDGFIYRGGCTFILDLASTTKSLKYAIAKKLLIPHDVGQYRINDEAIEKQWEYMYQAYSGHNNLFNQYFGTGMNQSLLEPFALLHQLEDYERPEQD